MNFTKKVMFLGVTTRHSKENKPYYLLKVLDKDDNKNFEFYTSTPEKYKDLKQYMDYDFEFRAYEQYNKDLKQNILKLGLVE